MASNINTLPVLPNGSNYLYVFYPSADIATYTRPNNYVNLIPNWQGRISLTMVRSAFHDDYDFTMTGAQSIYFVKNVLDGSSSMNKATFSSIFDQYGISSREDIVSFRNTKDNTVWAALPSKISNTNPGAFHFGITNAFNGGPSIAATLNGLSNQSVYSYDCKVFAVSATIYPTKEFGKKTIITISPPSIIDGETFFPPGYDILAEPSAPTYTGPFPRATPADPLSIKIYLNRIDDNNLILAVAAGNNSADVNFESNIGPARTPFVVTSTISNNGLTLYVNNSYLGEVAIPAFNMQDFYAAKFRFADNTSYLSRLIGGTPLKTTMPTFAGLVGGVFCVSSNSPYFSPLPLIQFQIEKGNIITNPVTPPSFV